MLRRFCRPYRRWFVIGPLTKVVEVLFEIVTPLLVAHMIDRAVAGADSSELLSIVGLLAAMAVVGFLSTLACQKVAALTAQGFGTDLRSALYAQVNELSQEQVDAFGTASLITRITSDVNQLQLAVALTIRMLIRWPVLAVLSVLSALLIDWHLGLVFLLCLPVVGVIFWVVMGRSLPFFRVAQEKLDRVSAIVREGLAGTRVVRAFVREGHEQQRFEQAAAEQADVSVSAGRLSALLNPLTLLVLDAGIAAILVLGGGRVYAGNLTQGQLVAFVTYMNQALVAVGYVANLVITYTRAGASARRVTEVLNAVPSVRTAADAQAGLPAAPACALELRDVSFTYPGGGAPALQHVSLSVPCGARLGIIGGTGSGKSTLASLFARSYDASAGSVSVLGQDVRAWDLAQLRGCMGYVPQRVALVRGTVRSNLLWGRDDATDAELWEALERAQAADFVRALDEGLDAPVEADGRNFSGGQRQRLTIARALVRQPRVLVLDDASSALDYATDARLRAALQEMDGLDATVIVSQRVASVRAADLICVLSGGEVMGLGSHDELARGCAVYREICETQHVDLPEACMLEGGR